MPGPSGRGPPGPPPPRSGGRGPLPAPARARRGFSNPPTRDMRLKSSAMPRLNSIHRCVILRLRGENAFAELPDHKDDGMIHVSCMSTVRLMTPDEAVQPGDQVCREHDDGSSPRCCLVWHATCKK